MRSDEAWADAGRKRPPVLGHHRDRNSGQFSDLHNCSNPLGTQGITPLPTLSCRLSAREWPDESVHALRCQCDPRAPSCGCV
jgi:hypothetical protein